jgi:autotransporter-associated beta strand protein
VKVLSAGVSGCLAALIAVGSVHAVVLDDFEGLSVGAINGQNGWHADSASAGVGRDFTRGGNQFLRLSGADNDIYKSLGAAAIPNGQTGTIFFRFMATSAASNHGIGVTEVDAPNSWDNYRATALIDNDTRDVKVQGRSGSSYVDLAQNGGANALSPLQWTDVWMVVNNSTDTADFYIRRADSTERVLVGSGLPFRNGSTTATLDRFLARVSTGTLDDVIIDDVHAWIGGVAAGDGEIPSTSVSPTLNVSSLYGFAALRINSINSWLGTTAYLSTTTTSGAWNTTGASGWTSGFYPGELWQMYRYTSDTLYSTAGSTRTAGLESQEYNNGTHDIGFEIFNSFGQGYKLTNNSAYKDVVLTAASTLSTRYKPAVGAIQSWGDLNTGAYQVIIDNMMNLEMLFWASKHGGGSNLYDIAVQHALTTQRDFVRPDGGTYHVVEYNRTTGEVIGKYTSQGYSNDSTWSRGQAWGIYGFTMSYRETGDSRFLDTAEELANYFLDHLTAAGVPYYDFNDPANPPPWDSSAAAVASSGLLELMNYVGATDRQRYFDAAKKMLLALSGPGFLSDGSTFQSILLQGTTASPARGGASRVGTSYGDYYYLEALGRYDAALNPVTWTGSKSSSWNQDPLALNWSKNGASACYMDLNNVIFDDTAVNTTINIDWDYVRPASLLFNFSSTKTYTLQGSYNIVGMCSLVKQGGGKLIILVPLGYSGTTLIEGGTVEIAGGIDSTGTSLIDVESGTAILKTTNISKTNLDIYTATAALFEVSGGTYEVGDISGSGTTQVDSDASLTAASICQDTLTIGNDAMVTIESITGGALSGAITSVPEPSTLVLLVGAFAMLGLAKAIRPLKGTRD